ncbi:MAG: N-acetylneuraminate synthase family protein [Nitrospirae bacterium]|nr:N-acetylneuraminate synthase family protein [Nitrospirota bacterium]
MIQGQTAEVAILETLRSEGTDRGKVVQIGPRLVGEGYPCFIVAEIGINHNGSVVLAKRLIDEAVRTGCDAVKFQKRTIEVVYTEEELARPRESPFGTTNGDLKRGLEFGADEYNEIDRYCRERGIMWFASCWDENSVDFIDRYDPPCYKVASACLTDDNLLRHLRSKGRPIVLSTGMSTLEQVEHAVDVLGRNELIILHCTSEYPSPIERLNLRVIQALRTIFDVPVGYSGHEVGLAPSIGAAVLGACMIERHFTLGRSMWGSDQAASVEPQGFDILVKYVRSIENALGDGKKRLYPAEIPILRKLRRVGGTAS